MELHRLWQGDILIVLEPQSQHYWQCNPQDESEALLEPQMLMLMGLGPGVRVEVR